MKLKQWSKEQFDSLSKEELNPSPDDISIERLIEDGLLALHREIKYLLKIGESDKLSANNSRDLRDHLKLLFELKERENDLLKGMTDEQLRDQAKEALSNESK